MRRAMEAFDAYPAFSDFNFVSPEIEALDGEARVRGGPDWIRHFWQLAVLHLVARSLQAPRPYVLPPGLLELLLDGLERIVEDAASGAGPEDPLADDDFVLDLALSRGAAIPFGTFFGVPHWVEEPVEGFEPGLWLQLHLGNVGPEGFGPETVNHAVTPVNLDRYLASQLTVIAAFHHSNPDCKGWFGAGWMLDPRVSEISPHLAWYPELMLAAGAHIIPAGTDDQTIALATSTSATRRAPLRGGSVPAPGLPRDHAAEAILTWNENLARGVAPS